MRVRLINDPSRIGIVLPTPPKHIRGRKMVCVKFDGDYYLHPQNNAGDKRMSRWISTDQLEEIEDEND